jgi:hypothetical protein
MISENFGLGKGKRMLVMNKLEVEKGEEEEEVENLKRVL